MPNRLLLDTHALVWLASESVEQLVPEGVRNRLREADERYVSAATTFEIAQKIRVGKLVGGALLLDGWERLLENLRATELPLTGAHMRRAGTLDWDHRDPFDRMLVAQAQLEGLTLLTADRAIASFSEVATAW